MTSSSAPPLQGIRVLELAGLAPGPFAGLLLSDLGASVLRIDRAHPQAHDTASPPPATTDLLTRRKASIALDLKRRSSVALLHSLLSRADVLIDPYRPGVLERIGLAPSELAKRYPRLIIARMTGFRRTGKYALMAGHDINYLAVSGVLSQLGRKGENPYAPGNVLGDFAGGGHMLVTGILAALYHRDKAGSEGKGQTVEANMVDGVAYLGTFPRLTRKAPLWDKPRGQNFLDGGCPWYDVYETKDGGHMSVGALEPQFYAELIGGLGLGEDELGKREEKENWVRIKKLFEQRFRARTREEWEKVFDGTDACCVPVLSWDELEVRQKRQPETDGRGYSKEGFDNQPPATLTGSPMNNDSAVNASSNGSTWPGLAPGQGGEEVLRHWMGWTRGKDYGIQDGSLVKIERQETSKL